MQEREQLRKDGGGGGSVYIGAVCFVWYNHGISDNIMLCTAANICNKHKWIPSPYIFFPKEKFEGRYTVILLNS